MCISVLPIILVVDAHILQSNVTALLNSRAEFKCLTKNAKYVQWKLNGKLLVHYNAARTPRIDVNITESRHAYDIIITKLTIKVKSKYHGLKFQCVAGDLGGGFEVQSKNATLTVQGTV